MNPPGVFKKNRGKRDLGEKFDSKYYPKNYKKDVIYMNYEDLLDNIYMEKKGIDFQLRPSNNSNLPNKDNENQIDNSNNENNFKFDDNNINLNSNKYNYNYNDDDYVDNNNINNRNIKNNIHEENEDNEIIMNNNKNNQFTFNQNYNNFVPNDDKNKNTHLLRGKKNKKKSDIDNIENNIVNRYEDNANIPEEEIENLNNNNYIENDINKENNDYQNRSSNNENITNNNINDIEDYRLYFVLKKLGLESLINVFESYHMSFNDVLFLSKDDLNELGFKIFQKNRLLSFIEEYTSKAKNYTLEEIKSFFEENNIFNISSNQE